MKQWSKILREGEETTLKILQYITDEKIGDSNFYRYFTVMRNGKVTKCHIDSNAKITLVCRRIVREDKERKFNAARQKRHRGKTEQPSNGNSNGNSNGIVTPPSSSSSSSSSSEERKRDLFRDEFETLWKAFPRTGASRGGKPNAFKKWDGLMAEGITPKFLADCMENYRKELAILGFKPPMAVARWLGPNREFEEYEEGQWIRPRPPTNGHEKKNIGGAPPYPIED